jgi:hypothetical protein
VCISGEGEAVEKPQGSCVKCNATDGVGAVSGTYFSKAM